MIYPSTVSLRRVNEVQDWVDVGNLTKALQTCEKWFKKGERSSAFLTKRALVLTLQKDENARQRGQNEAIKLCQQNPPLVGLDELLDLEKSFENLEIGQEYSQKAWDRAAKADPKNSDLQETRVRNCMDQSDWKGAQQAAMVLRKNFPTVRKYEFWAVFLTYLVSKHSESPPGMFGQLAYKMVKNMADKTPNIDDDIDLRSGKYIITSDELMLLLNIYHVLGKFGDSMEVLKSENLGFRAGVGKQEPSTFSKLYLQTLAKLGRWKDVAAECLEPYRRLSNIEKDVELNSYIDEAVSGIGQLIWLIRKAEDESVRDSIHQFINEAVQKAPSNMAFRWAQLELTAVDTEKGMQSPETLLTMCKSLFSDFCMFWKIADLTKETEDSLGHERIQDLIDYIWQEVDRHSADRKDDTWISRIKNALDLEYRLIISKSKDTQLLSEYICKCLKVYGKSYRQYEFEEYARCSGPIPAAMTLLRINALVPENQISLQVHSPIFHQACLLLFHAMEKVPGCEEPCVLFIPFASLLGLIPLALYAFKKLSIKNMQIDNFAHNIVTRISTLHPHDVPDHPDEKEFHPRSYLQSAIGQYRREDRTFARQIMAGMTAGAYVNAEYAIIARQSKANSICKRIYMLEERRIERLMGIASGYSELDIERTTIIDTRPAEGFPNLEPPNEPPFVEHLRFAPYPQQKWVSTMTAQDKALHKLYNLSQYSPKSGHLDPSGFQAEIDALDKFRDYPEDAREQFTEVEYPLFQIVVKMVKTAYFLKQSDVMDTSTAQSLKPFCETLVENIEKWLETTHADFADPSKLGPLNATMLIKERQVPASWLYFHWSYATLEALQALALFLKVVKPYHQPKQKGGIFISQERQQHIRDWTAELVRKIHDHARHLRSELDKPGFLDDMIDMILERGESGMSLIGQELEKVVEESTMERMLGMVKDAWSSGLEGIGKVKVLLS